MNNQKYSFQNINFTLVSVSFEQKQAVNQFVSPNIMDSFYGENINRLGFSLVFERIVDFPNNVFFEIKVKYTINFLFDQTTSHYFNGQISLIEDYIETAGINLLNSTPIISQSSLIIANITLIASGKPLILPPAFNNKTQSR